VTAFFFGVPSPYGKRAQFSENDASVYRSISARLVGERQLPRRAMRGSGLPNGPPPSLESDVRASIMLLEHRTDAAIVKLREEAKTGNPAALSDLAAALLTRYDTGTELEAIVAARKAIDASPKLAAAHFNLALALERVGLTPEARAEFKIAATLESDAAWVAEARAHASALRRSESGADSDPVARYFSAADAPEFRRILKPYLDARERKRNRSRWNGANVNERLVRAAAIYRGLRTASGSKRQLLARILSRMAYELNPREEMDPYAQRYFVAGLIHYNRAAEAVSLLQSLDADAFTAKGNAGWRAQIICEQAMQMITRDAHDEALDHFRDAIRDSITRGERALVPMFVDLANEIRTDFMEAALLRRDISTAFSYAGDPAGFSKKGSGGDLADVQRALEPRAAIVQYSTVHDRVIVFVIRNSDAQILTLDASAAEVREAAEAMRQADDTNFVNAAAKLHELVFASLVDRLEFSSTIAFVPHRGLLGIPFGALFDVHRGRFLIERLTVIHSSDAHAAIASSRESRERSEQTLLAIGANEFSGDRYVVPRLPWVDDETLSLASLSRCTVVLSGSNATPEAIQRELANKAIIHFAGHIVRNGVDVRLLLAPEGERDSLSATEIAKLQLAQARVVVLSACRGALPAGLDAAMPSVADAFLAAGVPVVIASSYEVEDVDAPATMTRLHTFIRLGDDPAEALRKTATLELGRGRGVPLSIRFMAIGGTRSLIQ